MKLIIILRSGTQIEVPVKEAEIATANISGELRELSWIDQEGASTSLEYVRVEDVVAVLRKDDE